MNSPPVQFLVNDGFLVFYSFLDNQEVAHLPLFIGDKSEGPVSEEMASNRKQCPVERGYGLFYELISLRYMGSNLRFEGAGSLFTLHRCEFIIRKPVLCNLWAAFSHRVCGFDIFIF
jgi:hypothetical protein